mgnify:CR=1 FL=1
MYFCTSINMHFLQKRKIHVKNLSYRVEIKSNIVILLINQGISGIFHKLTNEKKCAIIRKLIRKNNGANCIRGYPVPEVGDKKK